MKFDLRSRVPLTGQKEDCMYIVYIYTSITMGDDEDFILNTTEIPEYKRVSSIKAWITANKIRELNIAGPRGSTCELDLPIFKKILYEVLR